MMLTRRQLLALGGGGFAALMAPVLLYGQDVEVIEMRGLGAAGCVVLGEPSYYSRFGFKVAPSLVLPGVPPTYFQAISFTDHVPAGTVTYPEAFAARA